MALKNYGFIVLAPDYNAQEQHAVLENDFFRTEVVGVNSVEEAVDASRKLISSGVQLIELCGGFGEEKANEVIASLEAETPVGFVGFSVKENEKLKRLMAG
ncbi:MAG: DUF6506 family protein [Sneathiella sp.]